MPTKGFFSTAELQTAQRVSARIARCGKCRLSRDCLSPKMPPTGKGHKKILAVAEAPGAEEDRRNIQLIGDAGQLFRRYLKDESCKLDRDLWKTNSIICRPPKNRKPFDEEIEACRPNLIKTIETYQPNVILLLGGVAVNSLISYLWEERTDVVSRWAGWEIPNRTYNTWIVPTYHPAYLLRKNDKVLNNRFKKHLRLALRKKHRPYKTIPDDRKQVELIFKPRHAAVIIKEMIKQGGAVAFDYECNTLKPETQDAEIVTCSVCWRGKKTIAYPWHGEAIEATYDLIKSPQPKIASNIKFEDRWSRYFLGHPVNNWWWDTMIAAHILDHRPYITSIKFQAFVLLGAQPYDTHIAPYLKSSDSNTGLNRIKQLDLRDLLLYNGLDSYYEYKVAMKQIKIFKRKWK